MCCFTVGEITIKSNRNSVKKNFFFTALFTQTLCQSISAKGLYDKRDWWLFQRVAREHSRRQTSAVAPRWFPGPWTHTRCWGVCLCSVLALSDTRCPGNNQSAWKEHQHHEIYPLFNKHVRWKQWLICPDCGSVWSVSLSRFVWAGTVPYPRLPEPLLYDVGLVVWNGHSVTDTQHL